MSPLIEILVLTVASYVPLLNELNFSKWKEQVHLHLSVLVFDLALLEEKPTTIISTSSEDEKFYYKQ